MTAYPIQGRGGCLSQRKGWSKPETGCCLSWSADKHTLIFPAIGNVTFYGMWVLDTVNLHPHIHWCDTHTVWSGPCREGRCIPCRRLLCQHVKFLRHTHTVGNSHNNVCESKAKIHSKCEQDRCSEMCVCVCACACVCACLRLNPSCNGPC